MTESRILNNDPHPFFARHKQTFRIAVFVAAVAVLVVIMTICIAGWLLGVAFPLSQLIS